MENRITTEQIEKAIAKLKELDMHSRDFLDPIANAKGENLPGWYENYERILAFVGYVLFGVSRCFTPKNIETDFYFWPGYDSILGIDRSQRIQIRSNAPHHILGGAGFQSQKMNRQPEFIDKIKDSCSVEAEGYYNLSNTSLWFDCVLATKSVDELSDGTPFSAGGTHSWVSREEIYLTKDESAMSVLAVSIANNASPTSEPVAEDGVVHIYLDKHQHKNWGPRIASVLNGNPCIRTKNNLKWPLPHNVDDVDPGKFKSIRNISRWLYSIWLAGTFDPTLQNSNIDWLLNYAALLEDKGLSNMSRRIKGLLSSTIEFHTHKGLRGGLNVIDNPYSWLNQSTEYEPHEYNFWYTLALKKTVQMQDLPNELGSIMIFSSHEIPDLFFSLVKPWIESIYLEIRSIEQAILLRRSNFAQMISSFSHEVGKLGSQLLDNYLPTVPDVFGDKFGEPQKGAAWSPPAFQIEIPEEYKQQLSKWRVCPIPEVYEGLRLLFFIWGGSRNLLWALGLDGSDLNQDKTTEEGVVLKDLVKHLGQKAREIAAARVIVQQATPRSMEHVNQLQQQYMELCEDYIAKFDEPVGSGLNYRMLIGGKWSRPRSTYFVRALMAMMTNAAYHAKYNTNISVKIDSKKSILKVSLTNKPSQNEVESTVSYFGISSEGVLSTCVSELSGVIEPFPKPGTDPYTTSFWVPISFNREEDKWILPL